MLFRVLVSCQVCETILSNKFRTIGAKQISEGAWNRKEERKKRV